MTLWDVLFRRSGYQPKGGGERPPVPTTGSGVCPPLSERIAVLKLKKGETLIIKVAGTLTREQADYIQLSIAGNLPKGVKTFVTDETVSFSKLAAAKPRKRRRT